MQVTKFDNNNAITLEQVFQYVKKSDHEKLDDVLSINSNTLFYLKKFEKHGHRRFFFSLNWSFALLGVIWMAYRKMYWVISLMVLPLLLLCVVKILLTGDNTDISHLLFKIGNFASDYSILFYSFVVLFCILVFIYIVLAIPLLFMGNMIYFYHIKRWIRKSSSRQGVSKIGLWIALILSVTNSALSIMWDLGLTSLADKYKSMNQELSSSNHDVPSEPY